MKAVGRKLWTLAAGALLGAIVGGLFAFGAGATWAGDRCNCLLETGVGHDPDYSEPTPAPHEILRRDSLLGECILDLRRHEDRVRRGMDQVWSDRLDTWIPTK